MTSFFSLFFLPLGQDTLRYLEDWRPSPLTHHWLGQQVSTFEVKSPFIDDFDLSTSVKLERFCYQGPSKSLLPVAANMC